MYNAQLGMGRDPRYVRPIRQYTAIHDGNLSSMGATITTAIDSDQQVATHMLVSVKCNDTNISINGRFDITVAGDIVAQYAIPAGQQGQAIFEIVPIGKELLNAGNLILNTAMDVGPAQNVTIKITLFTTSI